MAGIDPFNSSLYVNSPAARLAAEKKKKETETKKSGSIRNRFSELLHRAEDTPITDPELPIEIADMSYEDSISFLIDGVTMAGDELKKSPVLETFAKYRKKVSQFLHFVEKNCYDMETQESARSPRIRRRKKYFNLTIIDEKLDQLAKDILYNQVDQIKMLAKIEEINGLLVDLTT